MEIVYGLNAEHRVVVISGDWDGFALSNDSSSAVARLVLYRSLWEFVDGLETREFLTEVFSKCRTTGTLYSTLYRCDSGTTRRLFRMTVEPGLHGMIFVGHQMIRTNQMTTSASAEQLRFTDTARCSFCCGLRFGGKWWPSTAIPDPLYFPRSYVICPECRPRLEAGGGNPDDTDPKSLLINGFGDQDAKVIPFPTRNG